MPATLPNAEWITGANLPPGGPGRKNYTSMRLAPQVVTAEEIAAVVAIPDQYLEDNTINLWNWCRPRLAEAIAVRLDQTVLFGGAGIPLTFPVGGIVSNTYSTPVTVGIDAVDGVNAAMSEVEKQGLAVTGHAADIGAKGQFRGVRDATGALLLGTEQVGTTARPTLYGEPIQYAQFSNVTPTGTEFVTGAWQYLVIGVRRGHPVPLRPLGRDRRRERQRRGLRVPGQRDALQNLGPVRLHHRQAGDAPRARRGGPVRQGPAVRADPARWR